MAQSNQVKENSNVNEQFRSISLDDFISGSTVESDIYVRLSTEKYLKIGHKGQKLDEVRLENYRKRGLKHLYMRRGDYANYVGFNFKLAKSVSTDKKIDPLKRINFLKHTNEIILDSIYLNGLDSETFAQAQDITESTLDIISEDECIFDLLTLLNSHSNFLYAHSVGVSLYSAMIAKACGWTAAPTLFKVSMGGLFHDIGKKEIDPMLLHKPRHTMTLDEVRCLESHSARGKEILCQIPSVSSDIAFIALQHHQKPGNASQQTLIKKSHIHPLARLVRVADAFCNLALKGANHKGMPASEALQNMVDFYESELDLAYFARLLNLFKFPLPPGYSKALKA